MTPTDPVSLRSLEGDELMDAAEALAASAVPADHGRLRDEMTAPGFLDRLDPPDAYEGQPMSLAIARILRTLADNPEASAQTVLAALTTDAGFTARWQCNELLIRALEEIRPASPEAVSYWRRHSRPEALHRHSAMQAICVNASAPAMPVLYEVLSDPAHERKERIAWMRDPVMANRSEPEILDVCERLLTGTLEPGLRTSLVEALFDYQPLLWYTACAPPTPPDQTAWTEEGREKYWRLGTLAIETLDLSSAMRETVERSIESVGRRPDAR